MTKKYVAWRKLTSWTTRNWTYILSLAALSLSTMTMAEARNNDKPGDDCWRITQTCEVNINQLPKAKIGEFSAAEVLAQTDYNHYISYKVEFQGPLASTTDSDQFITQVAETLADNRGWARASYTFNRVQVAAGANFTLVLIKAGLLDGIPGCSSLWSCRAGQNVYINEDRWNGATTAWNKAGGSLRDYRHMVVNHEVGHFLGHGHYQCSDGVNNLAPVMQQQSIDLQSCKFNPWPLTFEINGV